jgi:hypothetical protein
MIQRHGSASEAVAVRVRGNQSVPSLKQWESAAAASFCWDWRGTNSDPGRQTEATFLWSPEKLFVRFVCHYRELVTFHDSEESGRRDGLWDRDVVEIFLQPDRFGSRHYTEFEVAPNGMWLDLEIFPGGRRGLNSGVVCTARIESDCVWTAQMAIPMSSITSNFDPAQPWRVNLYRCEGRDPERWYSAWRPTRTPEPAFHVPEAFGILRFEQ